MVLNRPSKQPLEILNGPSVLVTIAWVQIWAKPNRKLKGGKKKNPKLTILFVEEGLASMGHIQAQKKKEKSGPMKTNAEKKK